MRYFFFIWSQLQVLDRLTPCSCWMRLMVWEKLFSNLSFVLTIRDVNHCIENFVFQFLIC